MPSHLSSSLPLPLSLLLFSLCLCLLPPGLCADDTGAAIDSHFLYSPVRVQIRSLQLSSANFSEPSRDYRGELRRAVHSFYRDPPPLGLGPGGVSMDNFHSFELDTGESGVNWTFTIEWNETVPLFHPYEQYLQFAIYCARQDDGLCDQESAQNGGVLRMFIGDDESSALYQARYWLLFVDSVMLQCCDGTWSIDRQHCPDCSAKDYLPLILGCVLGFVGTVLLFVGLWLACRVQKKRKLKRGVADAGQKPPPKNLVGAFPVQPSSPVVALSIRPDNLPPGGATRHHHPSSSPQQSPVVVRVDEPRRKQQQRREQPDEHSTPEGDARKMNGKDKKRTKR